MNLKSLGLEEQSDSHGEQKVRIQRNHFMLLKETTSLSHLLVRFSCNERMHITQMLGISSVDVRIGIQSTRRKF